MLKEASFKMKMLSEQNAKNTFPFEVFCQAKHKFAKALGFPETGFFCTTSATCPKKLSISVSLHW